MTESMVERVAKAIWSANHGLGWEFADIPDQLDCLDAAKAAINELREPTEAMMTAPANMPFKVTSVSYNQVEYSPRKLEWYAAIDAALAGIHDEEKRTGE